MNSSHHGVHHGRFCRTRHRLQPSSTHAYGVKIVTVSREIHDRGVSDSNEWVLRNSVEMGDIARQLDDSLNTLQSGGKSVPEHKELSKVASMCKETAYELQEEIAKLHLDPKKSGWRRALLKSFNTLRSQKTIDGLETKLQKQSHLLQTRLLTDSRLQQDALRLQVDEGFSDINGNLQQIVTGLAGGTASIANLLADLDKDLLTLIRIEGQDSRQEIKSHIEAIQSRVERERKQKEVLDSLSFTEINDRVNTIPESHRATFEWIFDPDTASPWDNLESWLRSGEALFWILGKPGSGKSVLMKFIVGNTKTLMLLEEWAVGKPVFHISFFIWKGGVKLQRQKRGLLCSLVLQLALRSEAYLNKVLSSPGTSLKRSPLDWSTKELSDLLVDLANMHIAKVCLFVDGLDESDVADADVGMLGLVEWLATLDGWKVCAASRPEPDFQAILSKYPKLRLQDLTKRDPKQYVSDKLQEISQYEIFDSHGEQSAPDALVELVCQKAAGVFLWVRFAVSTVIRGVRRMDGWEDLMKRLAKMPSELEHLYVDMWQRSEEDGSDYGSEAAEYFRMLMSTQDEPLSCFEFMVSKSKAARDLLEDPQACPSLSHLLRDCYRMERRIVSSTRGFLESCDANRLHPSSRAWAIKMTLAEDETPSQLRAFRHKQVLFVHRTAIDFLQETAVGRHVAAIEDSRSNASSKIQIDALLLAPYCEFPIVDLFDFRGLFFSICNDRIPTEERAASVSKFELIHEKIIQLNNLPEGTDMARNWIDAVVRGEWTPDDMYQTINDLTELCPFQYAIGWRSFAAQAGLSPYFQDFLSRLPKGKISPQYASCLAVCAAYNYHFHTYGSNYEVQQLELIKLLKDRGADLNIRYPLCFGSGPLVNPMSLFCTFHDRSDIPTEAERACLLSILGSLFTDETSFSQKSIHILHVYFSEVGLHEGDIEVSIYPASNWRFATRGGNYVSVVEFNMSALLRFYAQSIGGSEEQITSFLKDRPSAECTLLALTKRNDESDEVRRPVSPVTASREYYNRLDRCASFGRFAQHVSHRDRKPGVEEYRANASFLQTMDEIHDHATEIGYEELMISLGHWTTVSVTPGDIPFLQPTDLEPADCSKFMFPE